jgi:hypothetical protein
LQPGGDRIKAWRRSRSNLKTLRYDAGDMR